MSGKPTPSGPPDPGESPDRTEGLDAQAEELRADLSKERRARLLLDSSIACVRPVNHVDGRVSPERRGPGGVAQRVTDESAGALQRSGRRLMRSSAGRLTVARRASTSRR